jgi:hypothetical protein
MNTNTKPANEHTHDIDPESIAKLLAVAAERLDTGTLEALQRARNIALLRQSQRQSVLALNGAHGIHWPITHPAPKWMYAAIILLAATLVSVAGYWHHEREHDTSHLDVAILTDDLPMEIFVDR